MSEPGRAARFRRAGLLLALCLGVAVPGTLAAVVPTAEALLREAETSRSWFEQGLVRMRVASEESGRRIPEGEMDLHIGGPDRLLIVFRSGKQRERKVLWVEDRAWLIVPDARHPIPITADQRLAGAASLGDLARLDLAATYGAELRPDTEPVGGTDCHVLDLTARVAGTAYPSAILWVATTDRLPRRLLLRLPSGRDARQIDFVAYRAAEGGRRVVERLEITDRLGRRGGRTQVEFLDWQPRRFEPAMFTVEGAKDLP